MNKMELVTHKPLCRYIRFPLGLKNAPATFQRAMNIIVAPVILLHAVVYTDDVVVFFKTPKNSGIMSSPFYN